MVTYSEVPNKRVTFFPATPGQASWGKCNMLIRIFRVQTIQNKRPWTVGMRRNWQLDEPIYVRKSNFCIYQNDFEYRISLNNVLPYIMSSLE